MCGAAAELEEVGRRAKVVEPPDLVEGIMRRARSNPILSWFIVVVLALAALLMIINGAFELARNVTELLRREPSATKPILSEPSRPTNEP
jgi:hypothetical protein